MQKLINALAVLSFLGTASIIGGGTYVYLQREAILDNVEEQIKETIMGSLPGMLDQSVPELPTTTGPAIPF